MSRLGTKTYEIDDDIPAFHVSLMPAAEESVRTVLAASEDNDDGRSEWLWVRLPNGDLILGVYPQGDTYFAVEADSTRTP